MGELNHIVRTTHDTRFPVPGMPEGTRVLVTGGSGFLGRHVIAALNRAGVRPSATRLPGIRNADHLPGSDGSGGPVPVDAVWHELDITDSADMRRLLNEVRPEVILHLAAHMDSGRSYATAERCFAVNLAATHDLLVAAGGMLTELRRLVLVGSAEEYGTTDALPVTEEHPPAPVSPYSASKAAVTQHALLYHRLHGLPVTILRPFIVYGPGQEARMMLPQLIDAAMRGVDFPMTPGEQTRDFVHVDDVTDAMLRAAIHPAATGEVFNICSGIERSILSVARQVVEILGSSTRLQPGALPYRENEVMRLYGDPRKARELLGWEARIELGEGLARTINTLRGNAGT